MGSFPQLVSLILPDEEQDEEKGEEEDGEYKNRNS
jgi:hypothetical protein